MENSDLDMLVPLEETQSTELNMELNEDQQDESEPEYILETRRTNNPPPLALIEFRMQQLQSRRLLLLKRQNFQKKAEDERKEVTHEDTGEVCELEAIEKELEELEAKKKELEELEKQGNGSSITQTKDLPSSVWKAEGLSGGIYMLPPAQLEQKDTCQEVNPTPPAETPPGPIIQVDCLREASDVTRCPSCEEIISTEIHSTVSEAMWLFCCLCSMVGCVAGCCLMPFFMAHLKKVDHHCPQCQAHIHTYRPF